MCHQHHGCRAPERFVERSENEFRLIPMLREAAQRKDPYEILPHGGCLLPSATPADGIRMPNDDVALGKALADLAVAGRHGLSAIPATANLADRSG